MRLLPHVRVFFKFFLPLKKSSLHSHQYTCTKHCDEPYLDSDLMKHDWTEAKTTDIGTQIKYECKSEEGRVMKLTDASFVAVEELVVTCKFNSEYDFDLREFGCTSEEDIFDFWGALVLMLAPLMFSIIPECPQPNLVGGHGHFVCGSSTYELGSTCYLQCDKGYQVWIYCSSN